MHIRKQRAIREADSRILSKPLGLESNELVLEFFDDAAEGANIVFTHS